MKNNSFIVPVATGVIIFLTLILSIIVKLGTPFELSLLLVYLGAGLVGFGYSYLLKKFKMDMSSTLFLIFTIIAGAVFYINVGNGSEGFRDLAALLSWMLLMAASIIITLAIGLIARRRKH